MEMFWKHLKTIHVQFAFSVTPSEARHTIAPPLKRLDISALC